MRWALRFWPDTRAMVEDVIGMAGTNHGSNSRSARSACSGCSAVAVAAAAASNWTKALNSRRRPSRDRLHRDLQPHRRVRHAQRRRSPAPHTVHGPGRITERRAPGHLPGRPVRASLIGAVARRPGPSYGRARPRRAGRRGASTAGCAASLDAGDGSRHRPLLSSPRRPRVSCASSRSRRTRRGAAPAPCYVLASCHVHKPKHKRHRHGHPRVVVR